jgi:hypothetical protein
VQSGRDAAKGWLWTGDMLTGFPVRLIGPGRLADNVFPLARVRPATVERLATGAARTFGGTLDDVQAMTLELDLTSGRPQWSANVLRGQDGRLYLADLDGRRLRQPRER